ncbi:MAG TPA: 4-(cytidine 5'-diphospho)-2-C-methyl-D-erythritol kinase [Candidatus Polarisedimenticolaceae bacterium]|nr:4-(cytidine 5'-diphospho)-2-C-methyl-D-erythritol kinase [Candidatus Polarisedimenticolaceae bacterium]
MIARCPAKVNLTLRVLGRRPDGYHELRTVFQAVDLWDTLEAEPARGLHLRCDFPGLAEDGSNLVLRAASALREAAGRPDLGASLVLRKRIPVGGGMGGGSSDAAGALLLLSRLWSLNVPGRRLRALAAGLGSDVPFFLQGGTALGRGRGEDLVPLPCAGPRPILLGIPPFGTSTGEVYAALTAGGAGVSLRRLSAGNWRQDNEFSAPRNDLEATVVARWPEIGSFRDALARQGAVQASVAGSGSTVFGVFAEEAQRRGAAEALGRMFTTWKLLETRAIRGAAHVETGGTSG